MLYFLYFLIILNKKRDLFMHFLAFYQLLFIFQVTLYLKK